MGLGKIDTVVEFLRERGSELAICSALVIYLIGILNLTVLGSPIFVYCSYIGTILLIGGMLVRLGVLPTPLRSKNGAAVVLTFVSGLLFTTAVISMFANLDMIIHISPYRPITTPPSATNAGDYFDLPGPEVRTLGGPKIDITRPYASLFQPLLIASIVVIIIAIAIEYT